MVSLESISGTDEPIKVGRSVQVLIGGPETMAGFTENLTRRLAGRREGIRCHLSRRLRPEKLAGKTVRFKVEVKGLRRKELPELNDEFAQDLGDFRTVDELKDAVRKSILGAARAWKRSARRKTRLWTS